MLRKITCNRTRKLIAIKEKVSLYSNQITFSYNQWLHLRSTQYKQLPQKKKKLKEEKSKGKRGGKEKKKKKRDGRSLCGRGRNRCGRKEETKKGIMICEKKKGKKRKR